MATLLSLTLNVEDMLYGQAMLERPDMDTLATGVISATDTTWQFTSAGSQFWERGDFAEYDDRAGTAGEVIRLMADHSTAATDVTVVRAQRQTSAAAETSVGTATFIFTGSAVEDEWTSAGHGMSVGDEVVFLVAGTGATEYAADTIYWVATVPTADTFQLSATDSTTVLEGTAEEVFGVVQNCLEKMSQSCNRISCTMKMDYRKGKTGRLASKIASVEAKLGREVKK